MSHFLVPVIIIIHKKPVALPGTKVRRRIKNRVSSSIVLIAGSHEHKIRIIFQPDERIPEFTQPSHRLFHNRSGMREPASEFFIRLNQRCRHCHTLVWKFFIVARRIENPGPSLPIHQRAAGPAAVRSHSLFRFQRQRHIRPMYHILADHMPPLDIVPGGRMGICLIEDMIPSLKIQWRMGLIHPFSRGNQMILRTLSVLSENVSVQKPFFFHLPHRTCILQTFRLPGRETFRTDHHVSDQTVETTCFRIFPIVCMIYILSQINRRFRPGNCHMPPELPAIGQDSVDIQIAPAFLLSENNGHSIP